LNIISEPFIENVNTTTIDALPAFSEWTISGLTKEKCICVDRDMIYALANKFSGASRVTKQRGTNRTHAI